MRSYLDEWVEFCKWIETLPYYELITEKVRRTKMNKRHIEVSLKDGTFMDFDQKCNNVNYADSTYARFEQMDEHHVLKIILALIPHSSILWIRFVENEVM